MLEYQAGRLGLLIPNNVEQLDNIRPAAEVLQDLNLSLNLQSKEEDARNHVRER